MARAIDIHEPDKPTYAPSERRLSVRRALADLERTSVAAIDAAARELGRKLAAVAAVSERLAGLICPIHGKAAAQSCACPF